MPRGVTSKPNILGLDNHLKVSQILKGIAGRANLSWYHREVNAAARRWLILGIQHLFIARRLAAKPRDWRVTVSRCYYAGYNVSKCVRYIVNGVAKFDADDHRFVGDLPRDFPDRDTWSAFLVELRQDRNFADYEPWTRTKSRLYHSPSESVRKVEQFIKQSKLYLKKRGLS